MWEAVNDKIVFKLEDVKKNNDFINGDIGNLRFGNVTSVGSEVKEIKVMSNILIPFQDVTFLPNGYGICSERNIIATDNAPTQLRLEVKVLPKENDFEKLITGEILKLPIISSGKFKVGDKIKFKEKTFQVLDESRVLLPENKVFLLEK